MDLNSKYIAAKRRLFDKVYAERLNPEQCRAVFTIKGPLLVLAGAGSGKTTVLVNRISYLVKYGDAYFSEQMPKDVTYETVEALEAAANLTPSEIGEILPAFASEPCPPWAVLAITFTNKAAREIKTRLASAFNNSDISDAVWAGTFHSICVRILRKFGERIGLGENFSIYDTDDKKRLLSICMKELEIDEKRLAPRAVANAISQAKDRLQGVDDFDVSHDPRTADIKKVYALYQKKLTEYSAVDFDDIIMKTVELLESDSEVREYYQNKFKYVLVDEYQDTNYAQFVLTKLLSDKYRNIMVVGDDDQSIYRFRGATVENILNFDKIYPEAEVVKLEQNYRSTENILAAANAVIKNNGMRHDKRLWCDKGAGERITLKEAADQNEEGKYIIDKINRGVKSLGRKYSDYAILYRVNELARSLETSFAKSGVPYKILGGMRFYDRKEIKDILAYVWLVNSRNDNLRLKRIINEPKRKIGSATVEAVEAIAAAESVSMFEVMRNAGRYEALGKSCDKLLAFTEIILSAERKCRKPSELIDELFITSGYREMLIGEGFEGEGKKDNVNELIAGAIEYEKRCEEAGAEPTLPGFLEEIALVSDLDKYEEGQDAVVLMTVHSAKGLEFPIVFLAGMEDGIFPSAQNIGDEEEMSEERRLAYVAITRAKEKLYITYTKNRTMYGRTNYNILSGFIRTEVPEELIEKEAPAAKSGFFSWQRGAGKDSYSRGGRSEISRVPDIFGTKSEAAKASEKYGIQRIPVGARVMHAVFGEGVILSAKDLSGDVLYEVDFGGAGKKKLMATFAKLTVKK